MLWRKVFYFSLFNKANLLYLYKPLFQFILTSKLFWSYLTKRFITKMRNISLEKIINCLNKLVLISASFEVFLACLYLYILEKKILLLMCTVVKLAIWSKIKKLHVLMICWENKDQKVPILSFAKIGGKIHQAAFLLTSKKYC